MSFCLVSPKVWSVLESASSNAGLFAHGYTYSAHPIGAAAALATLRVIDEEHIVDHVAKLGPYLHESMRSAVGNHPLVGEIRGVGFMLGVELVKDRATKTSFPKNAFVGRRLLKELFKRGLISRALGDTLVFAPPLVIAQGEIDELVAKFADGLAAITREVA
jgi:L-2,4-diaminobutyrate transaminase